jgi:hypothetical protein
MNSEARTREVIKYYLQESGIFTEAEVSAMSTDSVNDSIRSVASAILGAIVEKGQSIDTSPIDRSRGDIKALPDLDALQTAINKLSSVTELFDEEVDPQLIRHLKEVERALLNLNKYSAEFKEAYRSRKTLLILRYQSLVMSIFSAVSYLISVMLDFSSGRMSVGKKKKFEETAPMRAISEFNRSVERGDFKEVLRDVSAMRESFSEIEGEKESLSEAYDLSTLLMDGIKTVYRSFSDNPKLIEMLYKAAGIITLLISMREVFYTFFKAKLKFQDMVKHVETFVAAAEPRATPAAVAKFTASSERFAADAEESTRMAAREIESENRELGPEIKAIPEKVAMASEEPQQQAEPLAQDFGGIGFDF